MARCRENSIFQYSKCLQCKIILKLILQFTRNNYLWSFVTLQFITASIFMVNKYIGSVCEHNHFWLHPYCTLLMYTITDLFIILIMVVDTAKSYEKRKWQKAIKFTIKTIYFWQIKRLTHCLLAIWCQNQNGFKVLFLFVVSLSLIIVGFALCVLMCSKNAFAAIYNFFIVATIWISFEHFSKMTTFWQKKLFKQ